MNKSKVLIVDDEELILRAYKKELEESGYHVLVAQSAKEALAIIKQDKVDIVLVDLVMPEMAGVEMCKVVKALSPDTEVVLMSGYIEEMEKSWIEFIKAGGRDFFLRKPLGERELIDTVKTILIEKGKSGGNAA